MKKVLINSILILSILSNVNLFANDSNNQETQMGFIAKIFNKINDYLKINSEKKEDNSELTDQLNEKTDINQSQNLFFKGSYCSRQFDKNAFNQLSKVPLNLDFNMSKGTTSEDITYCRINKEFTINENGVYLIHFAVLVINFDTIDFVTARVNIAKNGTSISHANAALVPAKRDINPGNIFFTENITINLKAGDRISLIGQTVSHYAMADKGAISIAKISN